LAAFASTSSRVIKLEAKLEQTTWDTDPTPVPRKPAGAPLGGLRRGPKLRASELSPSRKQRADIAPASVTLPSQVRDKYIQPEFEVLVLCIVWTPSGPSAALKPGCCIDERHLPAERPVESVLDTAPAFYEHPI
jgi:hypothetical protein